MHLCDTYTLGSVHTHTHTHTDTYTLIYACTHIRTHGHIHTRTCRYTHTHTCACVSACGHTHTQNIEYFSHISDCRYPEKLRNGDEIIIEMNVEG